MKLKIVILSLGLLLAARGACAHTAENYGRAFRFPVMETLSFVTDVLQKNLTHRLPLATCIT